MINLHQQVGVPIQWEDPSLTASGQHWSKILAVSAAVEGYDRLLPFLSGRLIPPWNLLASLRHEPDECIRLFDWFGTYRALPKIEPGTSAMPLLILTSRLQPPVRAVVEEVLRNDYSQTFVDCGLRPQNFVSDYNYGSVYQGYPKLQRVIELKNKIRA